jgi:hypothetical protein
LDRVGVLVADGRGDDLEAGRLLVEQPRQQAGVQPAGERQRDARPGAARDRLAQQPGELVDGVVARVPRGAGLGQLVVPVRLHHQLLALPDGDAGGREELDPVVEDAVVEEVADGEKVGKGQLADLAVEARVGGERLRLAGQCQHDPAAARQRRRVVPVDGGEAGGAGDRLRRGVPGTVEHGGDHPVQPYGRRPAGVPANPPEPSSVRASSRMYWSS